MKKLLILICFSIFTLSAPIFAQKLEFQEKRSYTELNEKFQGKSIEVCVYVDENPTNASKYVCVFAILVEAHPDYISIQDDMVRKIPMKRVAAILNK